MVVLSQQGRVAPLAPDTAAADRVCADGSLAIGIAGRAAERVFEFQALLDISVAAAVETTHLAAVEAGLAEVFWFGFASEPRLPPGSAFFVLMPQLSMVAPQS